MTSPDAKPRPKARDELLEVARSQFASAGFAATSLQHIADAAGFAKSNVLYHFDSKEAVLTAALEPAERALGELVAAFSAATRSAKRPVAPGRAVLEAFVDLLMRYRREAAIIIIQGQSLAGIPVIDRANGHIGQLAAIVAGAGDVRTQLRIGVGLAGAAYALAVGPEFTPQRHSDAETRAALIDVLAELFEMES